MTAASVVDLEPNMKAKVIITLPIDAVDEADAIESVVRLVAKMADRRVHVSYRASIEKWIRENGKIEVVRE